MIVMKPIGAVKIGNLVSRLTVGKPVPKNVLDYWKKTKQIEELKKAGIISDAGSGNESETKSKSVKKDEPFRSTEDR